MVKTLLHKSLNINTLLGMFFFMTSLATHAQSKHDCQELKVKINIEQPTQSSNGSIQVVSEQKDQDLRINLLASGGNSAARDKMDIKESDVVSLPAGDYDLIITDRKNKNACPLHQKIRVE